jgi:pyridoxamine 5'-phosphate oxidase-like protein
MGTATTTMPTDPSRTTERTTAGDAGAGPVRVGPMTERVWSEIGRHSFAVIGYATPANDPRSSGVLYKLAGRRMLVAVSDDSWKAKHIAASGRVAVTVPVRRAGALSLIAPIPPATISFHGSATVHAAGSPDATRLLGEFGRMLPADRRPRASIIEIEPEGRFVTYAIGIPLRLMADPEAARTNVPIG